LTRLLKTGGSQKQDHTRRQKDGGKKMRLTSFFAPSFCLTASLRLSVRNDCEVNAKAQRREGAKQKIPISIAANEAHAFHVLPE
jgi:hypothetical protein